MAKKKTPDDLTIHSFSSAPEFEAFLEREHENLPGFYLKLARKNSGIPSVTTDEAVEVALCFGWINGQGHGFDENCYLARYTPRRPKSLWSQKNVEAVEKLNQEGRMRPAGLAAVEAAKEDGRWERAYSRPSTITVPDDFAAALAMNPDASSFFENLNKTNRYYVLMRVQIASPSSRLNRINSLIEMLAEGNCPGQKRTNPVASLKRKSSTKSNLKRPAVALEPSRRSSRLSKLVTKK